MLNGTFETEAENGTITPYNKQGTTANYQSVETAGAFGGVAMRAVVTGDSDKVETVNAAETPVMSVRIDAQEDGLYTIWARVQVKSTAEDSVWYKLDKGGYRQIALPVNPSENPNQWQWVKLDSVMLSRGEHTVGLTPREAGGLIDKLSIGLGESFEPGGDDPLYESPPIREAGIEYEQNTSSYTDLTPPSIQTVRVEVLNFFKGIYRLTITDEDYTLDSRGTPFFFWSAEEGTFSEESADYKSVVFTADPGTTGRKVRVTVGIGDGLGQVSYRNLSLDGSEEQ